jgi:hypothetical protein
MSTVGFARMASVTASTKRNPAVVLGKVGAATTKLATLKVLPLMPTNPELLLRYRLETLREPYVTYAQGSLDILPGDLLVIGAVEYPVRGVGPWPSDRSFLEIVVDKVS